MGDIGIVCFTANTVFCAVINMKSRKIKTYDWSNTLVSIEDFLEYLKKQYPDLHHEYFVAGAVDKELKRKLKTAVTSIYEEATRKGFYRIAIFPDVVERLKLDKQQKYARTIFTSIPKDVLEMQLNETGIRKEIDEVILLDDIAREFNMQDMIKEDPKTFCQLAYFLKNQGFQTLESYTDDSHQRIIAAMDANEMLAIDGQKGFNKLYLFNNKTKMPKIQLGKVIYVVNNIFLVD